MARIIGAIATSHTPTIGFAVDRNKQDDPVWAPIFTAYQPVRDWLEKNRPMELSMEFDEELHLQTYATPETLAIAGDDRKRLTLALETLPPRVREV